MKEVVCPECHKLVRTSKDSCPNCGYPFKNIKMVQPNKTINEVPLQQIKKVYVKDDSPKPKNKKKKPIFGTEAIMILTIMFGLLVYTFTNVVPSINGADVSHIIIPQAINNFICKFFYQCDSPI